MLRTQVAVACLISFPAGLRLCIILIVVKGFNDIVAKLESLVAKLPHRGDARNPVQARFGERKFELVQAVAALRWVQNIDDIFFRIAVLHILLALCTCVVLR